MDKIQQDVLRFLIKTRGDAIIAPSSDPDSYEQLKTYWKRIQDVFPELYAQQIVIDSGTGETAQISALYVFADAPDKDGEYYLRAQKEKPLEKYALIGISKSALDKGEEYALMVLLHELTHVLSRSDNRMIFHGLLDGMILELNSKTGLHVVNDHGPV